MFFHLFIFDLIAFGLVYIMQQKKQKIIIYYTVYNILYKQEYDFFLAIIEIKKYWYFELFFD